MSTQNPYQSGQAQSQSGTATGRSPEYDDNLTVQDTTHGAGSMASARDTLGGQGSTGGIGGSGHATAGSHTMGDNRDGMGRDRTDDVTKDESGTLISADKVVGTAVYDAGGERLGTIDSIMLNKRSGKVAYAVMSFGGFLGIGERYHPLPWDVLTYDEGKGGYNVQHSADDLRKAPNYNREEASNFGTSNRRQEVDSYYGVPLRGGSQGGMNSGSDSSMGGTSMAGGTQAGLADTGTQRNFGSSATGIEAADAVRSTTGAGSTGMGSTAMGANRSV